MKEQYKKIGKDENLNYALKLLSRFNYSEFKLRKKLKNKKINNEEIDSIISKLKKYKLIDDNEYANNLVNLYINRHKGPNYIKEKLIESGIANNIINDSLIKIKNEDLIKALNELMNQLIKKYKKKNIVDIKNKVIKACLLKGYTFPLIEEVINNYF